MMTRFGLFGLVLICSLSTSAQPTGVSDVLNRMIQAYGGEENLRKLDRVVQEWDFVALMGNRHGKDVRSILLPDQLKVELTYPGKKETRTLNGDTGYVEYNGAGPVIAPAPQRDAMRLQLMRLYSPLTLRDRAPDLSLTQDGGRLAISLADNGLQAHYLVNRETWRIEKVAGTLKINGREMRFLTEYSDFEIIEGVLVHQSENKYAGEVNTAKLRLRRIIFEPEFDGNRFKP
jgi:hypothetical protein